MDPMLYDFGHELNWAEPPTGHVLSGQENYERWKTMMQAYLMFNQADDIVDGHWPEPSVSEVNERQRWAAWNKKTMAAIRMTMEHGPRLRVYTATTAKEIWDTLSTIYKRSGDLVMREVSQELLTIKFHNFFSAPNFGNRLRHLANEAARVGEHCRLPEPFIVSIFLEGIRSVHPDFVENFLICNDFVGETTGRVITLEEVMQRATEYEKVALKSSAAIREAPGSNDSKYCHYCQRASHNTAECWRLHPELRPRRRVRKRKSEATVQPMRKKRQIMVTTPSSDAGYSHE